MLNGHDFSVTINLYNALRHMRHEEHVRVFWIDAICICQTDIEERSKQVLRMQDIYSMARDVEVWLGTATDEDSMAMELIRTLGAVVGDAEIVLAQGFGATYTDTFEDLITAQSPSTLHSLSQFFSQPWWTRIWCVQELSLARQSSAIVRWGLSAVPWLDVLVAAYAIELCLFVIRDIVEKEYPDDRVSGFNQGIRMAQCRKVDETNPPYTLLELLNQHRDCEATDPRDKVYGLLGLAGDVNTIGIVPSYEEEARDIFINLFQRHVAYSESLDMMCAVRWPKNFTNLPSWVPDWSTDQLVPGICINDRYVGGNAFPGSPIAHFEKYAAAGNTKPAVSFSENTMSIKCIRVGKVEALGCKGDELIFENVDMFGRTDENGKSASGSEAFNEWLNMILDSKSWQNIEHLYGQENVLDAFCRLLVADRNNVMMKPLNRLEREDDEEDYESDDMEDEWLDTDNEDLDDENMDMDEDIRTSSSKGPDDVDNETAHNPTGEEENTDDEDGSMEEANILFSPPEMLDMSDDGFRATMQVCWGKRFVILDSGHLGLVPSQTEIGDSVVVALGCSMPLAIKRRDGQDEFVGECYIHGIMDSEMLNGTAETICLV